MGLGAILCPDRIGQPAPPSFHPQNRLTGLMVIAHFNLHAEHNWLETRDTAGWKPALRPKGRLNTYPACRSGQAGMPVLPSSVHGKDRRSKAQKVVNIIDRPVTKHPERRPERVPLTRGSRGWEVDRPTTLSRS